jgi:hypothetical protein
MAAQGQHLLLSAAAAKQPMLAAVAASAGTCPVVTVAAHAPGAGRGCCVLTVRLQCMQGQSLYEGGRGKHLPRLTLLYQLVLV